MGRKPWGLTQLEPYVHKQSVPTQQVVIKHDKHKPFPPVVLTDTEGNNFEAEVVYVDLDTIEIKLNVAVMFTATIY